MKHEMLIQKICDIAKKYIDEQEIKQEIPLTSPPYNFDSRALAALFIGIEDEFSINLDKVFDQEMDYSIGSIASAVTAAL